MIAPRLADPAALAEAARLIREGRLVGFPTETVYGLGADAGNDAAVAALFAAKGRPRFNPLIVHVAEPTSARRLALFSPLAEKLAERFWPGPLTLVLRRRPEAPLSLLATAGLDTVGLRIPAHPVALDLIARAGRPIAAPSANPSGRVSPTTAAHVVEGLGDKVAMVLDGGPCRVGLESTVLDLTGPDAALLRPGGVTREALEALAGPLAPTADDDAHPRSPGQLASHYAPRRPLRLMAVAALEPDEALLAFGPHPPAGFKAVINLSPGGDLVEAAANLFAALRALDRPEHGAIAVMPIPESGLGQAINDRLRRAAAPRPA
jgi:L-threonylcarbamoyladenylate synthase